MMHRSATLSMVLWCGFVSGGCASTPEPQEDKGRAATASATATASASAIPGPSSAPASTASAPSASTSAAPAASSAAALEMSPEQLAALDAELRSRRVFRHATLGNMPVRERNTWLLSEDRKELTLTCELDEDRRIESGSPVPKRWFVVSSSTFSTSDAPTGKAWAASYRRVGSTSVRHAPSTLCAELGEELALDCKPSSVRLYGPTAFVPVETRREQPIRWKPNAARSVSGTGCTASADALAESFYLPSFELEQPMVFFATDAKLPVERLVHSDAVQYAGFRESTLTPFDGSLPEYLRKP